jgi:hypothetical protein
VNWLDEPGLGTIEEGEGGVQDGHWRSSSLASKTVKVLTKIGDLHTSRKSAKERVARGVGGILSLTHAYLATPRHSAPECHEEVRCPGNGDIASLPAVSGLPYGDCRDAALQTGACCPEWKSPIT